MKSFWATALLLASVSASATRGEASPIWVTAYYLSNPQNPLQPSSIDFSALTHTIYFGAMAKADGGLDLALHQVESPTSADFIRRAHAANKKVLLSLGIEADHAAACALPQNREKLVDEAVATVKRLGFDGIDVDWEPLTRAHLPNYSALIRLLRERLGPKLLLTAAVADQPKAFKDLASSFDQINLMTYDLGGDWNTRVWHHSALKTPKGEDPGEYPSADSMVRAFRRAGVPLSKLGIGIGFYGYLWREVNRPFQRTKHKPTIDPSVSYAAIKKGFGPTATLHWDAESQASYLSQDLPGTKDDFFVSFDDERACKAKVSYARGHKLGGVMIWELGNGWVPDSLPHDPLLQAVKNEVETR